MREHERVWSGRRTEAENRIPEDSWGPFPSEDQQPGGKMKKNRRAQSCRNALHELSSPSPCTRGLTKLSWLPAAYGHILGVTQSPELLSAKAPGGQKNLPFVPENTQG